jgi:hypothetical protein
MPDFVLTSPDGTKYKVTAPDEAAAYNAFKRATSTPPTDTPTPGVTFDYKEPPIQLEPGEHVLSMNAPKGDVPQPPDDKSEPGIGESAVRGAYQGLTFDAGDRIAALEAASGLPEAPAALGPINTLYNATRLSTGVGRRIAETLAPHIFGQGGAEAYNTEFAKQRAANDLARETNPKAYALGQLAGGAMTVPFAPELAPFKAAQAANALKPVALPAAKVLANAATAGAGYGALTGAASAPDLTNLPNVAENAGKGAVTGAVLGPAVAAGVRGVAGVGNIARKQYLAMTNPQRLADEIAARKLAAEAAPGQTAIDVAQQARDKMAAAQQQAIPQPVTMADVAGPKVQSLAGTITRDPNEAGSAATKFLEQRHLGADPYNPDAIDTQKARISEALSDALGQGRVRQVAEDLVDQRAKAAKPLYQAAEIKTIPYDTPGGQALLAALDRIPQKAKNNANRILSISNEGGNQVIWKQQGKKLQLVAVPNVRRFNYIKQGLDQSIEREYDKETGRYSPEGKALIELKNEILSHLDNLVPEYKAARARFRGDTELLNALRQGRRFDRMTHDDVISEQAKLKTGTERELFRIGASEALRLRVNKSPHSADAVKQIYNSPEEIRKIREIARDPASFDALHKFLAQEGGMFKTGAKSIAGSETAARLAADADAGGEQLARVLTAAAQAHAGYFWGFMHNVGQMLGKINPEHRSAVMEAARKVVLNPDPQVVDAFIARVKVGSKSEADRIAIINALIKGVPRGAVGLASTTRMVPP